MGRKLQLTLVSGSDINNLCQVSWHWDGNIIKTIEKANEFITKLKSYKTKNKCFNKRVNTNSIKPYIQAVEMCRELGYKLYMNAQSMNEDNHESQLFNYYLDFGILEKEEISRTEYIEPDCSRDKGLIHIFEKNMKYIQSKSVSHIVLDVFNETITVNSFYCKNCPLISIQNEYKVNKKGTVYELENYYNGEIIQLTNQCIIDDFCNLTFDEWFDIQQKIKEIVECDLNGFTDGKFFTIFN